VSQNQGTSRYRRISATRPHKAAAAPPPDPKLAAAGAARYEQTIDLASDSSHARVVRLVGANKKVLELGCSTGYMSRVLREQGCRVVAIEQDADAAERAKAFCERVIVGDIDRLDLGRALGKAQFDVAVAADVLEHLKDPVRLLRALKRFLGDEGRVVASLPNVAHGSVRLALLGGEFQYRPTGLLDRTHLHFYTRETLQQLFDDAGFVIGHLERREVRIDDSEVSFDRAAVPPTVLEALSLDLEALTYQFVVVAHPLPRERLEFIQGIVRAAATARETAEARARQLADETRSLHDKLRELGEAKSAAEEEVRRLAGERELLRRRVEEIEAQRQTADARLLQLSEDRDQARFTVEAGLRERARASAANETTIAAQQAAIHDHERTIAAMQAERAEALARMAGMRKTRVWRLGMIYWWIEARLKSLLRL
jgi:2-polyprenyl-3-methyl-5-hydroxy-6-metoxy-1,4-benzoquinol methylase